MTATKKTENPNEIKLMSRMANRSLTHEDKLVTAFPVWVRWAGRTTPSWFDIWQTCNVQKNARNENNNEKSKKRKTKSTRTEKVELSRASTELKALRRRVARQTWGRLLNGNTNRQGIGYSRARLLSNGCLLAQKRQIGQV